MIALANTLSESQRLSKKHEWLCWHDYFGVRFFRNWILNSRLPTILSCSSSPNPKSQLVRYPNRETVGNDHKPWCVIAFCDQWGNTLREAPTLSTILGDFTFFALSLYPSHPLPLIKKTINWKKLWRRFVQQVFHKFKSKDGIRLAHKLIDY